MAGMNDHIHFFCTIEFKKKVEKAAEKMGLNLSNYCRLVLGQVIDAKKLKEIIDNLYSASEKLKDSV